MEGPTTGSVDPAIVYVLTTRDDGWNDGTFDGWLLGWDEGTLEMLGDGERDGYASRREREQI